MRQPELLAEYERLAHRDHRNPEDHVVADLRRLAVAGFAAMHDPLAHALEHRLAAFEGMFGTADHEGQRRRVGAAHAAGTPRSERGDAPPGRDPRRPPPA